LTAGAAVLLLVIASAAAGDADVAEIRSDELRAGGDAKKRYFLIGPKGTAEAPAEGYRLLVVLPGGDGGADFHPFVKRIFKHALSDKYLVAQPIAVRWTRDQYIVWPTRKSPVAKQKFSTEQFVEAVIKDVKAKHKLDERYVFTLSWSSSGPAAYAISLQRKKSVTGSYIAMSVFKPKTLPPLGRAKGHAYFLEHSPEDRVCPFPMAKAAHAALKKSGANAELATYPGGHGWQGDVFGRIRKGIRWLEGAAKERSTPATRARGRRR